MSEETIEALRNSKEWSIVKQDVIKVATHNKSYEDFCGESKTDSN